MDDNMDLHGKIHVECQQPQNKNIGKQGNNNKAQLVRWRLGSEFWNIK